MLCSAVFDSLLHQLSSSLTLLHTKIYAMSGPQKKINAKLSRLFLIAILFLRPLAAGADIILQNQREVPITVCSNGAIGPATLQPNETHIIRKPNDSLSFWACNVGDSECMNTQDPKATVAILEIQDDNSYWLSTQQGYNFAVMITCIGCPTCKIITCKANLTNCPHELQIRHPNSSGAVVACKCPPFAEGSKPDSRLYSAYSSLFKNSDCPMPCSTKDDPNCNQDDPSINGKTCSASRDLLVSFIDGSIV